MSSAELNISASGSVYPPSEDSFLLAKHAAELKGRILDMCTGSGICALKNAKANPENEVIGADINQEAVECATENAKANNIGNTKFIQSDLFQNVPQKFDGILCNPPYLPDLDVDKKTELPLSGGKTGREFTDRFIEQVSDHLNIGGAVLLIQSSINDKDKTLKRLSEPGFIGEVIDQESFFFEKLFLIRFARE